MATNIDQTNATLHRRLATVHKVVFIEFATNFLSTPHPHIEHDATSVNIGTCRCLNEDVFPDNLGIVNTMPNAKM